MTKVRLARFASLFRLLAASLLVAGVITSSVVRGEDDAPAPTAAPPTAEENAAATDDPSVLAQKHLIGPTAVLAETESKLKFRARVDTGATTTSLHVEEWEIQDESSVMEENLGKTIRFRIKNHRDESEWLEREIKEITLVKTSVKEQQRYKVPVELRWNDFRKEVLVTLNDRSHMEYQLLLGRNFLQGNFVVDVDLKKKASPMRLVVLAEPADESEVSADVDRDAKK